MLRWLFALASCVCSVVVLGCSTDTENRGRVFGKITLNGAPVANGQIRFFALSAEGIGTDGEVKDGAYDIPIASGMTAGTYRVEISSPRSTGRKVPDRDAGPGAMKEEIVEEIPTKFNQNSTLQIDFNPSAKQAHDFDLKK